MLKVLILEYYIIFIIYIINKLYYILLNIIIKMLFFINFIKKLILECSRRKIEF